MGIEGVDRRETIEGDGEDKCASECRIDCQSGLHQRQVPDEKEADGGGYHDEEQSMCPDVPKFIFVEKEVHKLHDEQRIKGSKHDQCMHDQCMHG